MKPTDYRRDIDGLRAIAVIAVIIYHLKESWLSGGFLGVDIFLVISGFIMTKIIFAENFSITSFYINRLKRILPAFLFIASITFLAGFLLYSTAEWELFTTRFKKSLSFVLNNFYSSKNIVYGELSFFDPSMHTWSLGLEMQFYVLYSIILVAFFYFKKKLPQLAKVNNNYILLAFFIVSLFSAEILLRKNMTNQAFYLLFPRIWEFIAGGFVALISNNFSKSEQKNSSLANFLGLIGFLLIALSFIFIKYETSLGLKSIAVVLGSSLVIFAGHLSKSSIISKLLSFKYVAFIGLISYSLYLWHWPIIAFAKQIYGNEISIIYLLIIGLAPSPLAYLSYKFIEKPLRNPKFFVYKSIGKTIKKITSPKIYNLVTLVLIFAFMGILYTTFNYASKIDEKTRGVGFKFERWNNACHINERATMSGEDDFSSKCSFYSSNNTIDFIILGNSMVANNRELAEGLRKDYDLGFFEIFAHTLAGDLENKDKFNYYMKHITKVIETGNIKFVLIANHLYENLKNFDVVLNEFKRRNIKMIILGVTPAYKKDPRLCLANTKLRNFLVDSSKNNCFEKVDMSALKLNEKEVSKEYNALYLDPYPYLIDSIDGKNYYADAWHLNITGEKYLYSQVKEDFIPQILNFVYGDNPPKKIHDTKSIEIDEATMGQERLKEHKNRIGEQ